MSTLVITIISLCAIGVVSAVILYFVAQKFKVEEDPRIDIVEGLLPGANCGGCEMCIRDSFSPDQTTIIESIGGCPASVCKPDSKNKNIGAQPDHA